MAFLTTLATHARDRADATPSSSSRPRCAPPSWRSSRRLPAGSTGPRRSRRSGGQWSRRRAGSSITTTPGSISSSRPTRSCRSRSRGGSGRTSDVDLELLRCRVGEGFTGWVAEHGEPLLINDANADSRGATIAGTDDVDKSMLVVPMQLRRRHRRGHHAVEARSRWLRRRGPAAADDPRRPRGHGRRDGPAADPQPGADQRAAPPARHERRALREPRPAPGREPHGRPPGPAPWASTNAPSATGTAPPAGSNHSATSRPASSTRWNRSSRSPGTRRPCASSRARRR